MPFNFQLQKLMDIMAQQEKKIDAKVMECNALKNQAQALLDEMAMRKNAAQKGLNAQMTAGATADVAASNDYIQLLGMRVEAQMKAVRAAEAAVQAALDEQTKARREREKFEKLRKKKFEEYLVEEKKREARKTDETAGTIFMKARAAAEEAAFDELERLEKLEKLKLLRALREKQNRH